MSEQKNELSFEQSIEKLEQIVAKLEQGDQPLNEMLSLFEQGVGLSRNCNELLEQAEAKINVLLKKDGEIAKEPFSLADGNGQ